MKVSVYLPDDLATRVREAKLPVSAICQAALDQALRSLAAADPFVDDDVTLPADLATDRQVVRHLAAALHLAYDNAARAGSATVETEDLLQGVLDEGESLMVRTLDAIDIDPASIQRELDALDRRRDALAPGEAPRASERARRAVGRAEAEAARRGQPLNLGHLLLALLEDGGGGAGNALRAAGLDVASARQAIAAMESGLTFGLASTAGIAEARIERLLGDLAERVGRLETRVPAPVRAEFLELGDKDD
jgi:ATP-dependent Clp protease ATP-binding subunit ClpC